MSELNAEQIRELVKSYLWLNDMDRKDVVADAALAYADLLEAQVEGRAVVIVKENGVWPIPPRPWFMNNPALTEEGETNWQAGWVERVKIVLDAFAAAVDTL